MPQLPFGFDPDSGTFANVKLPPPRVNNRYTTANTFTPTADTSYQPGTTRLNWWQRFDRFISNIGNWFAENYDEVVDRLSAWLYILIFVGAVIAVIATWVNSGFLTAIVAGVIAFIAIGLLYYIAEIVLPIVTGITMFAGRFIFWNAFTFLLFLCAVFGGWAHSVLRPAAEAAPVEEVAEKPNTYTCTARTLNVRSEPDTGSSVMGVLHKGDEIKVIESNGDFSRIEYNGSTGYVATRYITPVAVAPADALTTN